VKKFDYSLLKTRLWDKKIVNYIGLIHEYKGRQELYLNKGSDELDRLFEITLRQSTQASNEIEGIVTSDQRLKQLVEDKVAPKNQSEKEILGYKNVLNLIHDNYEYICIKPNHILQLHKELYSFMDIGFSGKFKDTPNEIDAFYEDGTKKVIFKPLDPFQTPIAIEELCNEYEKAVFNYNIDPLLVIPIFIHDFLCIHPFNDGNGRISRLLTTLLLYKSGYMIGKYISLEKKIQSTKQVYYDVLSESSNGWIDNKNDNTPFIKYLLGTIISAYSDFEDRVDLLSAKKSAKDRVYNAINKKLGKFNKNDIQELCPQISIKSIEKALKEFCDANKIQKVGSGRSVFYFSNDTKQK